MSSVNTLKMKMKGLQDAQFHCHQNVAHIKVRMARLLIYDIIVYKIVHENEMQL